MRSRSAVVQTLLNPHFWPDVRPTILSRTEHLAWNEKQRQIDATLLRDALGSIRVPFPAARWITVRDGVTLLIGDLPYPGLTKAATRVSKAARTGKLVTNGKKGDARRIERASFDACG